MLENLKKKEKTRIKNRNITQFELRYFFNDWMKRA